MSHCAVIDLGSNTIRLVVYEIRSSQDARDKNRPFRSLVNDKVMAGLAAYVVDGVFSDEGIKCATSVLRGHLKRATALRCKQVHIFATAVLRNARNCKEAVSALERNIGHSIVVLSAEEEARLGFIGAGIDEPLTNGTLVDIGGGSTELSCVCNSRDQGGLSIAMGSLSSFARFVSAILPTENEMAAINQAFCDLLAEQLDKGELPANALCANQLYGVGGSIRAAAKMLVQVRHLSERPSVLTPADIDELLQLCVEEPHRFAHAALKACVERVHTIVPGCVILRAVFEESGARELRICKHGIREGFLMTQVIERQREGINNERTENGSN